MIPTPKQHAGLSYVTTRGVPELSRQITTPDDAIHSLNIATNRERSTEGHNVTFQKTRHISKDTSHNTFH